MSERSIHQCFSVVFAFLLSACSSGGPDVQRPVVVDDVSLTTLVHDSMKFDHVRVRVKGIARIEFEGNAIYPSLEAYDSRQMGKAIWLTIGWPVSAEILQLNGREVVVEGVFDASQKGHNGEYSGSLRDIGNLMRAGPTR